MYAYIKVARKEILSDFIKFSDCLKTKEKLSKLKIMIDGIISNFKVKSAV